MDIYGDQCMPSVISREDESSSKAKAADMDTENTRDHAQTHELEL